jgi:hypothetical protein
MLIESNIVERLNRLRCPIATFAAIDGQISNSRLSESLRGLTLLRNEDSSRLMSLLSEMERLAALAAPMPLEFRNPPLVRQLLEDMRDGGLARTLQSNIAGLTATQ